MSFSKFILSILLLMFFGVQTHAETKPTLNVMTYMNLLDKEIISQFEKENHVAIRVDFLINPLDFSARIKSHMRVYDVMISDQQVLESLLQSHVVHDISPLWKDPVGVAYDSRVSRVNTPFLWQSLIEPEVNPYWRQRIVSTGLSPREPLMIALWATKEKLTSIKSKPTAVTQKWLDALLKQNADVEYPLELAFLGDKISAAVVFYSDYLKMKKVVPDLGFLIPSEGTFYNQISAAYVASSFQSPLAKKFVEFLAKNRKNLALKNQLANTDALEFKNTSTKNWEAYDEYGFILRRSDSRSP